MSAGSSAFVKKSCQIHWRAAGLVKSGFAVCPGMLNEVFQLGFNGMPGRLRSSVTVTPFASHQRLYSAGSGYLSFLNSNQEFCCPETASFEARQALSLTW